MEHDGAVKTREDGKRVLLRGAGVDHDRPLEGAGKVELSLKERALRWARRVVAEVVESGLPDGDGARCREERGELVQPARVGPAGFVRVHPEARVDALVPLGERERLDRAGEGRRDGDHPPHTCRFGPRKHL